MCAGRCVKAHYEQTVRPCLVISQPQRVRRNPLELLNVDAATPKGLTLVHLSAQLKSILWDRGAFRGCLGGCFGGV